MKINKVKLVTQLCNIATLSVMGSLTVQYFNVGAVSLGLVFMIISIMIIQIIFLVGRLK